MLLAMLGHLVQQGRSGYPRSCVVVMSASNRAVNILYDDAKPILAQLPDTCVVVRVAHERETGKDIFTHEIAERASARLQPYSRFHVHVRLHPCLNVRT